eukprot:Nk52_evm13s360 gene=Nk52_evmTU13s360
MTSGSCSLRSFIEQLPLFDNHAHNILTPEGNDAVPFETAFSEANGGALKDAVTGLMFKRSVKEAAKFLGCEPTLESLKEKRKELGIEKIAEMVFESSNIQALCLDDGIYESKTEPTESHKKYVPNVYRIMRTEIVLENVLKKMDQSNMPWNLDNVVRSYESIVSNPPPNVVGFKSIICYRSGLEIDPQVSSLDAQFGLDSTLKEFKAGNGPLRLANKNVLDYFFCITLRVASKLNLPVQLHTGFGDNDLDLRFSNPCCLRAVLEHSDFENAKLVLLHASYPYSKEAGYLAMAYKQVYVDFGLAIPYLSVSGMRVALSELFELSPISKILFSTDAHFFPLTYYIGVKWAKSIASDILEDAVVNGDLTMKEAFHAARCIFFENSRSLYNVKLSEISETNDVPSDLITLLNTKERNSQIKLSKLYKDLKSRGVKFVNMVVNENSNSRRSRAVTIKKFFEDIIHNGISLSECWLALPVMMDILSPGNPYGAAGEVKFLADLTTLKQQPWAPEFAVVFGDLTNGLKEFESCPRTFLRNQMMRAQTEFGLEVMTGLETEFVLMDEKTKERSCSGNYCSSKSLNRNRKVVCEMVEALESMGVEVDQFHAESAHGQFEIVPHYTNALEAADVQILVRETIVNIAQEHSLLATFIPKLSNMECGNGCHIHMSIWKEGKNVFGDSNTSSGMSEIGEQFMAGVLEHLHAIVSVTLPIANSYARAVPDCWSGSHQVWAEEDKNASLRVIRCRSGGACTNFEIKPVDSACNPYLGIGAIISAGLDGITRKLKLPAALGSVKRSSEEMEKLRLPTNVEAALNKLEQDSVLRNAFGKNLYESFIAVRKCEDAFFRDKSLEEQVAILLDLM